MFFATSVTGEPEAVDPFRSAFQSAPPVKGATAFSYTLAKFPAQRLAERKGGRSGAGSLRASGGAWSVVGI